MNWASWREFLAMGGYAFYVWMSYGLCAALLVLEVWQQRANSRRQRTAIKNLPLDKNRLNLHEEEK